MQAPTKTPPRRLAFDIPMTGFAVLGVVEVSLRSEPIEGRFFYECERCGMAGCPTFEGPAIPDDVLNDLYSHVHFNHPDPQANQ